jgi:hypothetical protein
MNNEIESWFLENACWGGVISEMSPIYNGLVFSSIVVACRIFGSSSSKIIFIVTYDKELAFLLLGRGVKRHWNIP